MNGVTAASSPPAYDIVDLTKVYPGQATPANDGITLAIGAGEIFGLLGANGAGKTTLVRQMVNLLAPTRGTIRLFGAPLAGAGLAAARQIGYMPQSGFALNNLTVGEALYFTAHLRGLPRGEARAERDRLLATWDLEALAHRVVSRLSGGQNRLVLLATTLAARPPVLILDEPTNDLDPQHRRLVWDHLQALHAAGGTTIVLVTHNVLEAERVIERVGILRAGRLLAVGRPGVLKAGMDRQLRLEVVFNPWAPPVLPAGAPPHLVAPGRWRLLIARDAAPTYLVALTAAPTVEDFQIGTPSLEDLYLSLTIGDPAPAAGG